MDREPFRGGCEVCDGFSRPLLCPSCVSKVVLGEKWHHLQRLQKQRQALFDKLNAQLSAKAQAQAQRLEQDRAIGALKQASLKATAAEEELKRVRREVGALQVGNQRRLEHINDATTQLAAQRSNMMAHYVPDMLRTRSIQLFLATEALGKEQRVRLKQLLEVLPLTITALRNGGQPSKDGRSPVPYVTVCGLRLPESLHPAVLDDSHQAQELGSALGYFILVLDLVAHYLGGPVLHHFSFRGSTSSLWAPKTFWDSHPPSSPSQHMRLHLQTITSAPLASTSGRQSATSSALSAFTSHPYWTGGSGASAARVTRVQKDAELARALYQLHRSIGALVMDRLGKTGARPPPDWSPFAWLAGLCGQLVKEPPAEPQRLAQSAAQYSLAASSIFRRTGPGDSRIIESTLLDGHDDDLADDWDIVQRPAVWSGVRDGRLAHANDDVPFLPPPPSQPDEVEHWTRAMFTDASAAYQQTIPISPVAAAAEHLRVLRRTLG
ncbi:hypothetical protein WJX72_012100 [[Myrmecia] bisecta]|uniref:Uncharacterized protein n=1 Tax=[Myrmecia] bisecta TaxID=41462 RepID=A0AAW1RA00_9CHLO